MGSHAGTLSLSGMDTIFRAAVRDLVHSCRRFPSLKCSLIWFLGPPGFVKPQVTLCTPTLSHDALSQKAVLHAAKQPLFGGKLIRQAIRGILPHNPSLARRES